MSNQANDILKDIAIDKVERKMANNPTIPGEMRNTLIDEEYNYQLHLGESKCEEPDEFEAEDCTIKEDDLELLEEDE
jgi:hypothetical protein